MRFIKDKWCFFSGWPSVPTMQWLEDAVRGSWEWQWTGFPEGQAKTQLKGKLQSLDPGKLVFWPGCHGDRQAAAAREEGTAASPTSRILRQPWWGRSWTPPFLPQIQRLLSAPTMSRLTGSGELPGSQKKTWQHWLLKSGFSASRPVASRCHHSCVPLSFWSK